MDENMELLKDYHEACTRLQRIDEEPYEKTFLWAVEKCMHWLSKDDQYKKSITVGTIQPQNNREAASNALKNFITTLEKIAIIKGLSL